MSRIAMTAAAFALTTLAIPASGGTLEFTDVTTAAGVTSVHDTSGFDHANYTGGGAVADFNNDGFQDLFVISGGGGNRPDALFINDGNGTFTDHAADWGLTVIHSGKGTAVGDFNRDGWTDLYVTSAGPVSGSAAGHHKLYRNNGNGTFTDIATSAGVNATTTGQEDGFGAAFGDYDLDGDLDLFVAGFADNNQGSRLFRNDGGETFTDVTAAIGFFAGTAIQLRAFAPRFADMDGDFYPEVLLVSDFGTNRYFRNDGDGTFTDYTDVAGAGSTENGMGQCIGDFDGDGRIDWYVTSIYFPSANWTGNKLYRNESAHFYTEMAASAGVDDGGYGWGVVAVDFDHDTRLDIAETNGGTGTTFGNEQSYLWMQNASGTFDETALSMGLEHFDQGRGLVNLDYDNDGDQDLVVYAYNDALKMFRNDLSGPDTNWLRVFLDTDGDTTLAPGGAGTRVTAIVGELSIVRYMTSGDNFLSHSELSAHFGLGAAPIVDQLRIRYPNGDTAILEDVPANQTITIVTTPPNPADVNEDGHVDVNDLVEVITAWGPCPADPAPCAADVNDDGFVNVDDLVEVITNWG